MNFWMELLFNISLLLAILVTPCLLLLAYWYRRQLDETLMVWKRPEMVVVTIVFSVAVLVLFIVGVSCFFSYKGELDHIPSRSAISPDKWLKFGLICMLLGASLLFMYGVLRMLLVQVITEQGIVVNDRLLRIPDPKNIIEWHEISDYYVISDYPNAVYTFIIQKQALKFQRFSLRLPTYIQEDFETLLENRMFSASAVRARSQISSQQ